MLAGVEGVATGSGAAMKVGVVKGEGDAKEAEAAIVALVGVAAEEGPGREGGAGVEGGAGAGAEVKTLLVDCFNGDLDISTTFLCIFNT